MLVWLVLGYCAEAQDVHAKEPAVFFDPRLLSLSSQLSGPPALGSSKSLAELRLLHELQATRTQSQVAAAQADDADETIFVFRTVLGPTFSATELPLTSALSAKVHREEPLSTAGLKQVYVRPRPYQADKSLHPVCKLTGAPNSYPSGHTMSAYLLAFTLAEMVPEKHEAILARADDYAHNRLICGVHYPSDLEASRRIAGVVFGAMLATPAFRNDLSAARAELRSHLNLPLIP